MGKPGEKKRSEEPGTRKGGKKSRGKDAKKGERKGEEEGTIAQAPTRGRILCQCGKQEGERRGDWESCRVAAAAGWERERISKRRARRVGTGQAKREGPGRGILDKLRQQHREGASGRGRRPREGKGRMREEVERWGICGSEGICERLMDLSRRWQPNGRGRTAGVERNRSGGSKAGGMCRNKGGAAVTRL